MLDAASNRRQTTIAGVTQTYALDASMQTRDLAANQYTFVGNSARSHDLMGNLVGQSDTGRQAFYDADNRLVQWTEGGKDVRYRYDVDGRRTVKEDVGTASFPRTVYFWDGWQTVEETNSAGTLVRQYVWGEGIDECLKAHLKDAADIDADSDTTDFVDLYYHHNSIGSVVAVTNAAGAVKESYRYSAFGKPTIYNASNVEIATTAVEQPFMFTGARYDFEEGSGLYQMRHRYYDPVVGRFVSRDPLGLWGDPSQKGNAQGYCGHNPVNFVDPLGLDAFDDAWNWARKEWDDATTISEGARDRWRNFRTRLGEAIDAAVELARPTEDDFKIAGAALAIPDPGVTEAVAIGVILAKRYKIFRKFRALARLRRARASSGGKVPDPLPDGGGRMPDAPGPSASGSGPSAGGAGGKPPGEPPAPPNAPGPDDMPGPRDPGGAFGPPVDPLKAEKFADKEADALEEAAAALGRLAQESGNSDLADRAIALGKLAEQRRRAAREAWERSMKDSFDVCPPPGPAGPPSSGP